MNLQHIWGFAKKEVYMLSVKLNRGEIFASPLDLNLEHGNLEFPRKPMLRFGMPVFDSAGRKMGIILLNYFGAHLLQHFHENMQGDDSHTDMLLNRGGYWLSSSRREDEWGFMLGKSERTFGHDFPEVWRAISAGEEGALLTDQGLFTYATVYPLLGEGHSSTGSALANAPSQKQLSAHEYHWKIVSFVPQTILSGDAFYNRPSGRIVLALVYLLLALATWVIASTTLNRKQTEMVLQKYRDHLEDVVEELAIAKDKAEAANKAKSAFLASMSHELKTPLNAIIGFSGILADGSASPVTEEQKEYLDILHNSGHDLLSLINNILDLSRMEAGEIELKSNEFDLDSSMTNWVLGLQQEFADKNISLGMEAEPDIGTMTADEPKLKRVVHHLLSNVLKFTDSGGSARLTARSIKGDAGKGHGEDWVEISVKDTGIGISQENQKKLFQPFVQLDDSLSRQYEGTGLGLMICKHIVELHGGQIWAESEPGKGSSFSFTIPRYYQAPLLKSSVKPLASAMGI
jgi:signal transduction histidine kinase